MLWEVEQKFPLSDAAAAKAKLAELGAPLTDPIEQTDHYFNHPARDFSQTDEALRLRQVGEDNWITYKGPRIDAVTKTRRELELPLAPGRQMHQQYAALLTALGFRLVGTVRKRRRNASLNWEGHAVDVAVDEVADLGAFLEIEIAADDSQLESAKKSLESLSSRLGLGSSERRSYLELLLNRMG